MPFDDEILRKAQNDTLRKFYAGYICDIRCCGKHLMSLITNI